MQSDFSDRIIFDDRIKSNTMRRSKGYFVSLVIIAAAFILSPGRMNANFCCGQWSTTLTNIPGLECCFVVKVTAVNGPCALQGVRIFAPAATFVSTAAATPGYSLMQTSTSAVWGSDQINFGGGVHTVGTICFQPGAPCFTLQVQYRNDNGDWIDCHEVYVCCDIEDRCCDYVGASLDPVAGAFCCFDLSVNIAPELICDITDVRLTVGGSTQITDVEVATGYNGLSTSSTAGFGRTDDDPLTVGTNVLARVCFESGEECFSVAIEYRYGATGEWICGEEINVCCTEPDCCSHLQFDIVPDPNAACCFDLGVTVFEDIPCSISAIRLTPLNSFVVASHSALGVFSSSGSAASATWSTGGQGLAGGLSYPMGQVCFDDLEGCGDVKIEFYDETVGGWICKDTIEICCYAADCCEFIETSLWKGPLDDCCFDFGISIQENLPCDISQLRITPTAPVTISQASPLAGINMQQTGQVFTFDQGGQPFIGGLSTPLGNLCFDGAAPFATITVEYFDASSGLWICDEEVTVCCGRESSLTLNTGVAPWYVTVNPNGLAVPFLAHSIAPHPAWKEALAGSSWISPLTTYQNEYNGFTTFKRCFCLLEDGLVTFSFNIRTDDRYQFFVDDVYMGDQIVLPSFSSDPPDYHSRTVFLTAGQHCLVVKVQNTDNVAMGFNLAGWILQGEHYLAVDGCCNTVPETLKQSAHAPTIEANEIFSLQASPNPASDRLSLSYSLPDDGYVKLQLFDLMGRELMDLVNSRQARGRHEFDLNTTSLAEGVYLLRLSMSDKRPELLMISILR